MFLNHLSDAGKENFIELAYKLAYSNREFPQAQQKILSRYMEECGVRYIPSTMTREELIKYFGEQSPEVKKIIYLEIYMLLISDEEIDADETKVLSELKSGFGLSDDEAVKIQEQGMEYKKTYLKLRSVLGI